MKRIVLLVVAALISICGFAQSKSEDEKSESKTLEFMAQGSSLIKKEFYDLGTVKGVKCQVLILTNILKNYKIRSITTQSHG